MDWKRLKTGLLFWVMAGVGAWLFQSGSATNWPTTLSSDANLFIAVNNLSTTLTVAMGPSTTTINVASASSFPTVGMVSIDNEVIHYTGKTATKLTGCTRGYDTTTAASHVNGTRVYASIMAKHHNLLKDELIGMSTYFLQGSLIHLATATSRIGVRTTAPTVTLDVNGIIEGTEIRPTTSPWIDVKAMGVLGDNSTDDTAAIQAILTTCQAAYVASGTGCTLFFPEGIYKVSAELTYTGSLLHIVGAGRNRSVIKATNGTQNVFHFSTGGTGSAIRDIGISYTVYKSSGSGIWLDTYGGEVSNVSIHGQWIGIRLSTSNFPIIRDCLIEPTTGTTSVGILVEGGAIDQDIRHVEIHGDTTNQPMAGIRIRESGAIYLTRNGILHCGIGILIDPTGTDQVNPIHMYGNIIDSNNSGAGMKISPGASARVGFLHSVNNSYSSNGVVPGGYGIDIDGAGTIVDLRFSNDQISNNGSHGVHHAAGTDIHFVGNSILGNGQSATNVWNDVDVGGNVSKFSYIGNRMGTTAGYSSTEEKFAIQIATGGSTQYQIIGNNFNETNSGGLFDSGTGTEKQIFGNIPYSTEDSFKVSSLTSGRVVTAGTSGILSDSALLTWDGINLGAVSIKNSALTSGRVTFAGAFGLMKDSATFTYNGANTGSLTIGTTTAVRQFHISGAQGGMQISHPTDATQLALIGFDGTSDFFISARGGTAGASTAQITFHSQTADTTGIGYLARPGTTDNASTIAHAFTSTGLTGGRNLVVSNNTGVTTGVNFAVGWDGTVLIGSHTITGDGLVVGNPTGGGKGYGTINAQAVYDDNAGPLTDYVFDLYFDGKRNPKDTGNMAYRYKSINDIGQFIRANRHLPSMPSRKEWEEGGPKPLGDLVTRLWETVEVQQLYLQELHERLNWFEENYGRKPLKNRTMKTKQK